MSNDEAKGNLERMERLDFEGWNKADWRGTFAHLHTEDVYVDFKGSAPTKGIDEHIQAMESFTAMLGGTPPQIVEHPIAFGSGEWTCVVGQASDGSRMVTVARWVDGAISEEYMRRRGHSTPIVRDRSTFTRQAHPPFGTDPDQ